jgi:N-acetylmuramoyl-L-alanine amidase
MTRRLAAVASVIAVLSFVTPASPARADEARTAAATAPVPGRNSLRPVILPTRKPPTENGILDAELDRAAEAGHGLDREGTRCLARNIYHEARGENLPNQAAVAEVTLNRARRPEGDRPLCEVVYERRQFSWTHRRKRHHPTDMKAWETAVVIAVWGQLGAIPTFTRGATHFYEHRLPVPGWAGRMVQTARIGAHVFLVDPRDSRGPP